MIDINQFLSKRYVHGSYDCFDFCAEVWLTLTGRDLGVKQLERAQTATRLNSPIDPCIVFMSRPSIVIPHVGVYMQDERGQHRCLHLNEHGAFFDRLSVAEMPWRDVRYYFP